MKLTIGNLDKIKQLTIEPEYGVQYRIDRIAELYDRYRFYWCRHTATTDEVIMIELSRIPSTEYDNLVYKMQISNDTVYSLTMPTLRDVNAVVEKMLELTRLL
jgi:hypothetical protein